MFILENNDVQGKHAALSNNKFAPLSFRINLSAVEIYSKPELFNNLPNISEGYYLLF